MERFYFERNNFFGFLEEIKSGNNKYSLNNPAAQTLETFSQEAHKAPG